MGFPGGSVVKNLPAIARDSGLIPGLEKREEGDRGDQEEKMGSQKERDRSGQ